MARSDHACAFFQNSKRFLGALKVQQQEMLGRCDGRGTGSTTDVLLTLAEPHELDGRNRYTSQLKIEGLTHAPDRAKRCRALKTETHHIFADPQSLTRAVCIRIEHA